MDALSGSPHHAADLISGSEREWTQMPLLLLAGQRKPHVWPLCRTAEVGELGRCKTGK